MPYPDINPILHAIFNDLNDVWRRFTNEHFRAHFQTLTPASSCI